MVDAAIEADSQSPGRGEYSQGNQRTNYDKDLPQHQHGE
jgi:hypothetical protein